ncbi:hypothetical protein PVA45_07475 (plasmid) [Entomospira entomophila]|uniref:Uncharacterized protein n=1 Tax=Entomospira entomophila TaxID=2719988 RepID=A0A968G9Y8_9SPIO|nr:hypothetical protein [Entomospira entomophilus]NIZ41300.1 hypothetical protein [Entomospira entomophilus]WDI36177.1 hypothetical protein PVA45_07475 [Entomospira entomophilus]
MKNHLKIPHKHKTTHAEKLLNGLGLFFAVIFLMNLHPQIFSKVSAYLSKVNEARANEVRANQERANEARTNQDQSQQKEMMNSDTKSDSPIDRIDTSKYIVSSADEPTFIPRMMSDIYLIRDQNTVFQTDYAEITFHSISRQADPNQKGRSRIFIDITMKNRIIDDPKRTLQLGRHPVSMIAILGEKAETPHHEPESGTELGTRLYEGWSIRTTIVISVKDNLDGHYIQLYASSDMFHMKNEAAKSNFYRRSRSQPYIRFFVRNEDILTRSSLTKEPLPDAQQIVQTTEPITHIDPWKNRHIYHLTPDNRSFVIGNLEFFLLFVEKEENEWDDRYTVSTILYVTNLSSQDSMSQPINLPFFSNNLVTRDHQIGIRVMNEELETSLNIAPDESEGMPSLYFINNVEGYYLRIYPSHEWFPEMSQEEYAQNYPGFIDVYFEAEDFL